MTRVLVVTAMIALTVGGCSDRRRYDPVPCGAEGWEMPTTLHYSWNHDVFDLSDAGVPDYAMDLNEDAGTVTELYSRGGHRYRVVYAVESCERLTY